MSKGSLVLDEKIYLSNKTLIDIKDLKVGDKILSLKIIDENINDIVDIYSKYIIPQQTIENIELCESAVYSIEINNEESTDFIELNKFPIKNYQYIVADINESPSYKFRILQPYIMMLSESDLKIKKINPLFNTEQLQNLDIFENYNFNKNKFIEYKKSSISLTINHGHFYFTENFIVFAGNAG